MLTSSTIRFTTDTFGDPLTFEDEEATPKTFTVTWKNYDGTVLETDENVTVGTTPTYDGATPTKPDDDTYTYTFSKWNPDVAAVTAEATYTAKFTRTKKKYTVTWENYDGTVLEIDENVTVGTTPTYDGATPTKPDDDTYTYTFLEWSPTPQALAENTTYTATFSRAEKAHPPSTFTVTWKNYDGTVLKTDENVEAGTTPTYDGATPTKDETATDTALFNKWTPTPAPITADTTYIASFNFTPKTFTVTWKNYDGTVLETDENVEAGTTPTYDGATPTKDEDENYIYDFSEWNPTPTQIFGNATYTAIFSQAEKPQSSTPETFTKKALLTYKKPFDFTNKSAVDRFVITGNEPEGSRRRIIFKIDEQLYRFRNGALQAYTWGGELDDILVYGNRVSVLEALENVNAFVGKKVYPIIALKAPYDATDMPTIKLAVESRANADQLTDTVESPVYEITDGDAQVITSISYKPVCTGNGSVEVSTRLRDQTGWSEYMEITEAVGKEANAIQFKFTYIVTKTDGADSAKVESVTVSYASGQAIVTGGTARLFSKVRDYEVDLQSCYVVVRHEPLVDSTITAYVNFMDAPKHRDFLRIGIGTGSRQELLLGTNSTPDKNIVASSIKIYQDGELVDDYDFSAELSTVVFSAKKNSVIFASYDYDYGPEKWLEMTTRLLQPYNDDNGTYVSRFFLNLNPADAIGKRISNVQIRLKRLSGIATETLGVATGRTQLFTLEHNAVPSSINFSEDVDFSFDEESGILSCVATAGTLLNVSYNWQGKGTVVYSFAAGWVPNSGFEYQEGDYQHSLIGGSGSDYELPTMSELIKGGAKLGANLMLGNPMDDSAYSYDEEALNALSIFNYVGQVDFTPVDTSWHTAKTLDNFDDISTFGEWYHRDSKYGDIVDAYQAPGSGSGFWAFRAKNTWYLLDYERYGVPTDNWDDINPLLTVVDRHYVDLLPQLFQRIADLEARAYKVQSAYETVQKDDQTHEASYTAQQQDWEFTTIHTPSDIYISQLKLPEDIFDIRFDYTPRDTSTMSNLFAFEEERSIVTVYYKQLVKY